MTAPRDGRVARLGWRALATGGGALPLALRRGLASAVLRAASRDDEGYRKNVYRVVAPHRRDRAPGVTPLPERWWHERPLVRTRRLGLELELDLRDNLQRTLFFTGAYEPAVLRALLREWRPGDVVVDVGAHVGVHALPLARHAHRHGGGRVIAFEPASDSCARLRAAAGRNGLRVEVVQTALDAQPGAFDLRAAAAYGPADAGVRSRHGAGEVVETVQARRFDDWASETRLERLDLLKLDVEGDERRVLQGMRTSLRRFRPRLLVAEARPDATGSDAGATAGLLAELGYRPTGVTLFSGNELYRPW